MVGATLTSGGRPVKGETITFKAGSTVLCTAATNANGVARCSLTSRPEPQVLLASRYSASFGGDSRYKPSSAAAAAIVL